jgi:hypothetical protein
MTAAHQKRAEQVRHRVGRPGIDRRLFQLRTTDLFPPLYFGSMPNGYSKLSREARISDNEAKNDELKSFEDAYRKFIENK